MFRIWLFLQSVAVEDQEDILPNQDQQIRKPQSWLENYQEQVDLKVPKFSDARKLRCNHFEIKQSGQILNQRDFCPKYADGMGNSEDPGQNVHCLP